LFDFDDDITPAEARLAHDYLFGFLDYPDTGTDDYFGEKLQLIRIVNQAEPAKIRTVLLSYLRIATNHSLRADIENLLQSIGGAA
jgi:hypothetical protein